MNYPEIFQTVEVDTIVSGSVEMPHMGAEVAISPDEDDGSIQITIDQQWFCRYDLLELAKILIRIAATMDETE